MTGEITIAAWPRNSRETIRVCLDLYNGRPVIAARCWYTDNDGELKPGRAGLTLSINHLSALAEAFAQALVTATAEGLLEGAKL